jgi:streptogramin lyase
VIRRTTVFLVALLLSSHVTAQTPSAPFTEFAIPYPKSGDPKNPAPDPRPVSMTVGPDGNLWFTQSGRNKIGRVTPAGVFTEFPVPWAPHWITTGADSNLWFTARDTALIGRMTLSGLVTEFAVPHIAGRITAGPDGNLWFTSYHCPLYGCIPMIGRMDLNGGVTTFSPPADVGAGDIGATNVFGITSGPDGSDGSLQRVQ